MTIGRVSLSAYLATLDAAALSALLEQRPDLLVEPAPRDVAELADRLDGVDTLSRALFTMDHDELTTARTAALCGSPAETELVERLGPGVGEVVDRLAGRGLAWRVDGRVGLPGRLAAHFAADLDGYRPAAAIARQMRVDQLREALVRLDADPGGTKAVLTERLAAVVADPERVLAAVTGLALPALKHLEMLLNGGMWFGGPRAPERALLSAGLLLDGAYGTGELPREVVATMLLGPRSTLAGRPALAPAAEGRQDGRAGAEAAVLAAVALLDEATEAPLAALKKGGIGSRERKRLATRLGLAEPALMIDVVAALGLLVDTGAGYAPADRYAGWRDEPPAQRWADLARAWFDLDVTPTRREVDDGEVAPPLPLASTGGLVRRALLGAAAGGWSLRAAAQHVAWFAPLHGCDDAGLAATVGAARREAELLGVVAGDRLTTLGELLATGVDDLAGAAAQVLPEVRGQLVLQSDLSAMVSGQASAAAARVLAAAAVPEGHGMAVTWRFSPASVRAAMDAGWTADQLRAELAAASERALPQPLDYLIGDVARRHGGVRVREVRCCVTGAEAELEEILHTRPLAKLGLRRLAPTVLTSSAAPEAVLAAVRKAGFTPMPEDADGAVVVAERAKVAAPSAGPRRRPRRRVDAAELAARLVAGSPAAPVSPTRAELAALNPALGAAEIALLADALDHGHDVRIRYRNRDGSPSVRDIAPAQLWDRWITAWCYLRSGDRDFAVARIEGVGPVG